MHKVKKFWHDHKTTICLVGGAALGVATTYFMVTRKYNLVERGQSIIHWAPGPGSMGLEQVKRVFEANKDNTSSFAIFRDGPKPNEYVAIVLSDGVVRV